MNKILIVEDNRDTLENISELFTLNGYKTLLADNGKTALRILKNLTPDCVILDIRLPDMTGLEILQQIQEEISNGLVVIIITAYGEITMAVQAMKNGAYDYIEKPFENEVLLVTVKHGLSNQQIKKELNHLRRIVGTDPESDEIFGHSPEIRNVIKQIDSVAAYRFNDSDSGRNRQRQRGRRPPPA